MFDKEEKIVKSLPMPNWFEMELVESINSLAVGLKVSSKVTGMKDKSLDIFLDEMLINLNSKKIRPSEVAAFKEALTLMKDFLWIKLRITIPEDFRNTGQMKADYEKKLIHILEKKKEIFKDPREELSGLIGLVEKIAGKSGSKDLMEMVEMAKRGEAEIVVHKVPLEGSSDSPFKTGSSPIIPDDIPTNVAGEDNVMESLSNLFNSSGKGQLKKPKK